MTRRAIVSTPDTCGGKPRIDGTRIPVSAVCSFWNDGYSVDRILAEYPSLTADDVVCAVAWDAAAGMQKRAVSELRMRADGVIGTRANGTLRVAAELVAALPLEPEQE